MPGFNIHIAVANKYLNNNKNKYKSRLEFLKGSVYPDLSIDKAKSHCSGPINDNLSISLKSKVNLGEYLSLNKGNTDFDEGVLLHLVTDYYFYNYFFDSEYIRNTSYDQFQNDIYYSFDQVDDYVKNKYSVEYEVYRNEILSDFEKYKLIKYNEETQNIIDIEKLDKFIDAMSIINLDDIKNEFGV